MIITISVNDDSIRIQDRNIDKQCKLKNPRQLADLLVDVFETITDGHDPIGIELYLEDEDKRYSKGEW